jgi:hypothetical protein
VIDPNPMYTCSASVSFPYEYCRTCTHAINKHTHTHTERDGGAQEEDQRAGNRGGPAAASR